MLQTAVFDSVRAARTEYRLVGGGGTGLAWKYDIMVSDEGKPLSPQVFLIEQSPLSITGPHFHAQDEFQVVVDGDGSLGAHEIKPITVHYANGYTGYGPLRAGPKGLWYLTMRVHTDNGGAKYLPESRHLLTPGDKLSLTSAPAGQDGAEPYTDSKATQTAIISPRPDGIAAWRLRMSPAAKASPPTHPGSAGQFRVVLRGGMIAGNEAIARFGCMFISADEKDPGIASSEQGLDLLILQFSGTSKNARS